MDNLLWKVTVYDACMHVWFLQDNVVHHFSVPGGADTWTDRQIPVYFDVSKYTTCVILKHVNRI